MESGAHSTTLLKRGSGRYSRRCSRKWGTSCASTPKMNCTPPNQPWRQLDVSQG